MQPLDHALLYTLLDKSVLFRDWTANPHVRQMNQIDKDEKTLKVFFSPFSNLNKGLFRKILGGKNIPCLIDENLR